jgi:hypothetical protein
MTEILKIDYEDASSILKFLDPTSSNSIEYQELLNMLKDD